MKFPYAEERFISLKFEDILYLYKGNRSIFVDKKESIQGLMRKRLKKVQTYYEEKNSQVYIYKPYSLKDRECKPVTRQAWDYEKSIKLGCIYLSEVKTKSLEIGKIDGYFTKIELCSLSIPGLKKNKSYDLKINTIPEDKRTFELKPLIDVLYHLNKYFLEGFKVENINEEKLKNIELVTLINEDKWIEIIESFEYELYEDGFSRVGKDDVFWDELEVSNLPDNYYLVKVIIKCIKLHVRNVEKVEQVDNKLIIEYFRSHGYCPAPNERQVSNNDSNKEYLSYYLKNKLFIHIHKYFDQDKYYYTSFCDILESQDLKAVFR